MIPAVQHCLPPPFLSGFTLGSVEIPTNSDNKSWAYSPVFFGWLSFGGAYFQWVGGGGGGGGLIIGKNFAFIMGWA